MLIRCLTGFMVCVAGLPAQANTDYNSFYHGLAECAAFVTGQSFDVLGTYGETIVDDGVVQSIFYPSVANMSNDGPDMAVGISHEKATSTVAATWMCSGAGTMAPRWQNLNAFELPNVAAIMNAYGLQAINFPTAQHVFANCNGDKDVFAIFNAAEEDLTVFAIMENSAAQIYCDSMGMKALQIGTLPIPLPGVTIPQMEELWVFDDGILHLKGTNNNLAGSRLDISETSQTEGVAPTGKSESDSKSTK